VGSYNQNGSRRRGAEKWGFKGGEGENCKSRKGKRAEADNETMQVSERCERDEAF